MQSIFVNTIQIGKHKDWQLRRNSCIYLRDDVTDAQIIANLLSNPVKALIESGFFFYNEDSHVFFRFLQNILEHN